MASVCEPDEASGAIHAEFMFGGHPDRVTLSYGFWQ
jgi:hypothetical protein